MFNENINRNNYLLSLNIDLILFSFAHISILFTDTRGFFLVNLIYTFQEAFIWNNQHGILYLERKVH